MRACKIVLVDDHDLPEETPWVVVRSALGLMAIIKRTQQCKTDAAIRAAEAAYRGLASLVVIGFLELVIMHTGLL